LVGCNDVVVREWCVGVAFASSITGQAVIINPKTYNKTIQYIQYTITIILPQPTDIVNNMKLLNAAIIAVIAAATPSKASAKKLGGPTINKERKLQDEVGSMPSTEAVEALSGDGFGLEALSGGGFGFSGMVSGVAQDLTAGLIYTRLELACFDARDFLEANCDVAGAIGATPPATPPFEGGVTGSRLCDVSANYFFFTCLRTCIGQLGWDPLPPFEESCGPFTTSSTKLDGPTINEEQKLQDEVGSMPSTEAVEALSGDGGVAQDVAAGLIDAHLELECFNARDFLEANCDVAGAIGATPPATPPFEGGVTGSRLCDVSANYFFFTCIRACFEEVSLADQTYVALPPFVEYAQQLCPEP